MKTRKPTDPARLHQLTQALSQVSRSERAAHQALHAQLRFAILQCVNSGQWRSDERVPTEAELIELTGWSPGTVQRALHDLVNEGAIRRQRGNGSFVASTKHRIDDATHARFLADDGCTVLPVFSRALYRHTEGACSAARHRFPADAQLVRLDRVLDVNGEFDIFSRFVFDSRRFPELASRPLETLADVNLKQLLAEAAPLPPGGVAQTVRLVPTSAKVAQHLALDREAWVLRLDIVRRIAGSLHVLYVQELFVPPNSRPLITREDL